MTTSSSVANAGALVTLQELNSGSPYFREGASLRVTGKLQGYSIEDGIAEIVYGNATLRIDTQHLKLSFRVGSIFQFIGELIILPTGEAILKARVGRNVDGIDLNLYHQSIKLVREFISDPTSACV